MKYNINFHQTFKPERAHISNLLTCESLNGTKESISHRCGIPTGKSSGKVEVNLLYAQAAGLLTLSKTSGELVIKRSFLGDIVHNNDSFLDHEISQLIFHYNFCKNTSPLILWNLLFSDFKSISKVFKIFKFKQFVERKLGYNNIKTSPTIGTYISDFEPLIDLGLLEEQEQEYSFGRIEIISSYSCLYAYLLYDQLLAIDPNRRDFTLDELTRIGFHLIFGWDTSDLRNLLEILETKNYISINKQFSNFHIHILKKKDELIENLYY
jgi:hypothetical protein